MGRAFACFDGGDLLKIAGNGVRALSTSDPQFDAVCERCGFDPEALGRMRDLAERMAASAASLSDDPASFDGKAHHQLVKDFDAAVKAGFRSVTDLPALAAALEERMHTHVGGGSISTALFVGESLADLETDGKKAWATRIQDGREIDDIGFVEKRDGWKIKLFARRPAR